MGLEGTPDNRANYSIGILTIHDYSVCFLLDWSTAISSKGGVSATGTALLSMEFDVAAVELCGLG